MINKKFNVIEVVDSEATSTNDIFPSNTIIRFYNDVSKFKISDGKIPFNDLEYYNSGQIGSSSSGTAGSIQISDGNGGFSGDNSLRSDNITGLISVPGFTASDGQGHYAQAGFIYNGDGEENIFLSLGGNGSVPSYLNLNSGGGLYNNSLKANIDITLLTENRDYIFPDRSGTIQIINQLTNEDRDLITTPIEGQEIYNLSTHKKNFYNGVVWEEVTSTVIV